MEQPLIKKNIHKYMKLKGYRYYLDLLYEIAKKLNKSSSEAKTFVIKEKSNFSKMLNGIRPLKYEYIIPLEEIFGVSLAKLLNEDLYNINIRAGDEIIVPKNEEKYFNIYVIESGDSLYKIAEKYNLNPTLLAALNGLEMEDYIYPGQELLIPKNNYSYYITAEGDTIDSVSKLFKISQLDLIKQNETIYLLKDQVLVSKR